MHVVWRSNNDKVHALLGRQLLFTCEHRLEGRIRSSLGKLVQLCTRALGTLWVRRKCSAHQFSQPIQFGGHAVYLANKGTITAAHQPEPEFRHSSPSPESMLESANLTPHRS